MDVERLFEDRVVCFVLGRLSVFFDLRGILLQNILNVQGLDFNPEFRGQRPLRQGS